MGPNDKKVSKRNKWADKEAGFLGVGVVKDKLTVVDGWRERWNAFILLHETLEEYGIHLVEAAWTHQVSSNASSILPILYPKLLALSKICFGI